jgi:hypothetical protein
MLAVVPALVAHSQVGDTHAAGEAPYMLFYDPLYVALPELLNWLMLGLAIGALISIARANNEPEIARRIAARRIGIPVMLLLFYGYSTWLYIPVTFIIGLVILAKLVLPCRLVSSPKHNDPPHSAITQALDAWRNAEFAAKQRQQLLDAGTEDINDRLTRSGAADYIKTFDATTSAQNKLARQTERWQGYARSLVTNAFDHKGQSPSLADALCGAIIGLIFGIIPGAVTLLTKPPH